MVGRESKTLKRLRQKAAHMREKRKIHQQQQQLQESSATVLQAAAAVAVAVPADSPLRLQTLQSQPLQQTASFPSYSLCKGKNHPPASAPHEQRNTHASLSGARFPAALGAVQQSARTVLGLSSTNQQLQQQSGAKLSHLHSIRQHPAKQNQREPTKQPCRISAAAPSTAVPAAPAIAPPVAVALESTSSSSATCTADGAEAAIAPPAAAVVGVTSHEEVLDADSMALAAADAIMQLGGVTFQPGCFEESSKIDSSKGTRHASGGGRQQQLVNHHQHSKVAAKRSESERDAEEVRQLSYEERDSKLKSRLSAYQVKQAVQLVQEHTRQPVGAKGHLAAQQKERSQHESDTIQGLRQQVDQLAKQKESYEREFKRLKSANRSVNAKYANAVKQVKSLKATLEQCITDLLLNHHGS